MKLIVALALISLASCSRGAPDAAETAEATVRARFGQDERISSLTRTVDGGGYCGMLLGTGATGYANGAVFIVEGSKVTLLGNDPAPYERCGEGFVAPHVISPIE